MSDIFADGDCPDEGCKKSDHHDGDHRCWCGREWPKEPTERMTDE